MPAHDYRTPAPVEREPVPQAEIARLGTLRSVHAAPSLRHALVGPIVIAALSVGVGAIFGVPLAIGAVIAAVTLGVLAWSPVRLRGRSVELHAHGLVLQVGQARRAVAFEDVNETWFEISPLHSRAGAYLRAIRILDFAGHLHRVPLALKNGTTLGNAVLRACSEPLLREAGRALKEGQTLTFAKVQLDRDGISVDGSRSAWDEVRLAVVSHARVHLYGRIPIFAWRTVRLDRIPNPAVFVGLVGQLAKAARVDDRLLAPVEDDRGPRGHLLRAEKDTALRAMLVGAALCIVGVVITLATHASSSVHLVAWGPIVFGAVRFCQGLALWFRTPR